MRASSLPLSAKCPASAKMESIASNKFATLGTAFHELMAFRILNKPDYSQINDKLTEVGLRHGLTKEDKGNILKGLYNVEFNFPDNIELHVEEKMTVTLANHVLSGSPDLYYIENNMGFLFDYKSGWGDVEPPKYNLQMIGYALLILKKFPKLTHIGTYIVQPKLNQILDYSFSAEEIEKNKLIIIDTIKECSKSEPTQVIGEHCKWCSPMTCSAYIEEVKTFDLAVRNETFDNITIENNLQFLLPFAKGLSNVCKKIEDIAKAYVDANGSLRIDKNSSYVRKTEERKKIDFAIAESYLKETFGNRTKEIIKIGVTDLKKLSASTERGLSKVVMAKLDELGAITRTDQYKYKIIHDPILIEEKEGKDG